MRESIFFRRKFRHYFLMYLDTISSNSLFFSSDSYSSKNPGWHSRIVQILSSTSWVTNLFVLNCCSCASVKILCFLAHASILFIHGKHPKTVQERLGHADIRTTLMTYSHVTPTLQKEAVEVFEDL